VSRFSLHVRADCHARVGISIGTATYGTDGETLDQLLIAADQAMYQVKSAHKVRQATLTSVASDGAASPQAELPTWVPGSDLNDQNLPPTSVN
jgi:predicted signal transduction protein with EAL and GGDEF domain